MCCFGEISVERHIYRDRSDEANRSVCPLEMKAGIVGGFWTPKAAKIATLSMSELPSARSAQLLAEASLMKPCSSSLDNLIKRVGEYWEQNPRPMN